MTTQWTFDILENQTAKLIVSILLKVWILILWKFKFNGSMELLLVPSNQFFKLQELKVKQSVGQTWRTSTLQFIRKTPNVLWIPTKSFSFLENIATNITFAWMAFRTLWAAGTANIGTILKDIVMNRISRDVM